MAFCTKCGKEIKETDKFCYYCGTPVQPPAQNQGPADPGFPVGSLGQKPVRPASPASPAPVPGPAQPYPGPMPKKQNRALPFLIAGGSVLLAAIVWVAVISLFRGRSEVSVDSPDLPSSSLPESVAEAAEPPQAAIEYKNYANKETLFALDYPQDYDLSEPYVNGVLISDGSDFRAAAEYAVTSASGTFLYSAADFAAQIDADPQVLSDWVGSPATVTDSGREELGGQTAYRYEYETQSDGVSCEGQLYILDGQSEYGCYCFQTLTAGGKEDDYEEQIEHMEDSFRVTGAYQAPGYQIHSFAGDTIFFAVPETAGELDSYGLGTLISYYPVDGVFVESNIWIDDTSCTTGKTKVEDLLFDELRAAFKNVEAHGNGYTNIDPLPIGRYPYWQIEAEFYKEDTPYTKIEIALDVDGTYWTIEAETNAEYEAQTRQALELLIMSLRFGKQESGGAEGEPAQTSQPDVNDLVKGVIRHIKGQENYSEEDFAPSLVSVTDEDGNGCLELLALYQTNTNGLYQVRFDVWAAQGEGTGQLATGVVFDAVGGNGGSVGLAKDASGKLWVEVRQRTMMGTSGSSTLYRFLPFNADGTDLDADGLLQLEEWNTYNQDDMSVADEGWRLDGEDANKAVFMANLNQFTWVYTMDIYDAPKKPVMSFDDAEEYDFNRTT